MTAGITGIYWLPRLAEGNSTLLTAGPHAVPATAAATAWGTLTAAWVDATATVARVMAELGVGMVGLNGAVALTKLAGFTSWAEQQSIQAAAMGAKASAHATANTVASLAMPSLPEIAAVDAARVAAHAHGGDLDGSAEAAEAAKAALDVQAALVMDTYESTVEAMTATPAEFLTPPPIAAGAGLAEGSAQSAAENANGDPLQTAIGVAQALATDPGVVSAATQAAQVAGSVASTGVSTVGNVAGTAIAAASHAAPATSMTPMMMGGVGGVAAGGAAVATRAVSFGGAVSIGNGAGTLKLPEGWGAGNVIGGPAATAPTVESAPLGQMGAPTPARSTNGAGNPLLGRQANSDDDEAEHHGNDYLRGEHFADGRIIAPGVIGADPAVGER
ncbi:PPE domain-containing protein [Nocardia veterana]|uniref:PPE domain-containing protein n=1 Tax=Nocardia veterana TaxID=132249 RepID=A0A7X6LWQ2_9NOCA|nr:PPE domain-containing protein [Nocardia veterana]NKY85546.1 PPE domain-containing protein [Nocardia veterana]